MKRMSLAIYVVLIAAVPYSPLPVFAEESCLACHSDETLDTDRDGRTVSLYVDPEALGRSAHVGLDCGDCHEGFDPDEIPHARKVTGVECGSCHARPAREFAASVHAKGGAATAQVPGCTTCHGTHSILPEKNPGSRAFRMNVPELCGECHREKGKATLAGAGKELAVYFDYSTSVHGKGLYEKGLLPSAICSDCHGSHGITRHGDVGSPVRRENVSSTCGSCHKGMLDRYRKGIHFSPDPAKMASLPTCAECHSAHRITEVDESRFMKEVTHQCGTCHSRLSATYLKTMHGKAYNLDYLKAARCSDCHDPHYTLHVDDPESTVGPARRLDTCRKCHPSAGWKFTQYLTHADYTERDGYPFLYATYVAMTALLVAVFGFFGIHTIFWLPRSLKHAKTLPPDFNAEGKGRYVRRFTIEERATHVFVIVSFLLLALTGMVLKFSSMGWALFVSKLLGGAGTARIIHRVCAVVTFGYFFYHFYYLWNRKRNSGLGWKRFLLEGDTLVPTFRDIREFFDTFKWFVGLGARPKYGRWTYWEKFDYLAVFWGVPVIGISGLFLWFPEFFTRLLPGWAVNVATIIHSDEALLAVGFIFTIHFLNTHLKPGVFPMDKAIFTGLVPEKRFIEERPGEYEEMVNNGEVDDRVVEVGEPSRWSGAIRVFAGTSLAVGILLVLLILYSMVFG